MIKKILIIIMAITVVGVFGCKKLEESGITIDKAITVLEYAKTAKQMINAGNANSMADDLLKQINKDKDTGEGEESADEESSEGESE
jgi:hypothetical protein